MKPLKRNRLPHYIFPCGLDKGPVYADNGTETEKRTNSIFNIVCSLRLDSPGKVGCRPICKLHFFTATYYYCHDRLANRSYHFFQDRILIASLLIFDCNHFHISMDTRDCQLLYRPSAITTYLITPDNQRILTGNSRMRLNIDSRP